MYGPKIEEEYLENINKTGTPKNIINELNVPQETESVKSGGSELTKFELESFRKKVLEWLTLDDEIRALSKAVKERKQKKKDLNEYILKFMGEHDIENLNTKDGKLKYSVSYTKKSVTKATIKNRLVDWFKNVKDGEKCAEFIFNSADKQERVRLKRTFKKK